MSDIDRVDLRRARRIAADFRPNEQYERLLAWRDEGSPRWADVSRTTQIACGLYEDQRRVAAGPGADLSTPPND